MQGLSSLESGKGVSAKNPGTRQYETGKKFKVSISIKTAALYAKLCHTD